MTPVEIARKAGPCGSKAYHNAYQKARYKLKRQDPVYLEKERAYNRARYAKPEVREAILVRSARYRDSPASKKKEQERGLRKHYKLTVDQYVEMERAQQYRCAICRVHKDNLSRSLEVDHNHSTGKIRGLLCRKCNLVLGIVDDNVIVLNAAIYYLKGYA